MFILTGSSSLEELNWPETFGANRATLKAYRGVSQRTR